MRFPPPVRVTAPLLALVFGLVATWFDYRLNLDLDTARHLDELRETSDATGSRLALLSGRLLASGQREALLADVQSLAELPSLEIAAVTDEKGLVVADSLGELTGQTLQAPRLKRLALLTQPTKDGPPIDLRWVENADFVMSAHAFRAGESGAGWVLLKFDRSAAIAAARADALTQLRWMGSAMALLSFSLWAVLHFGFAERLTRLARSVRDFGEGKVETPQVLSSGDEVGALSSAFSAMAVKLQERSAERDRLESELLDASERERRRIGQDLHDGLGQRLTAASLAVNALTAALKIESSALAQRTEDLGRQLREAIAEARGLSHGLAPVAGAEDGLMSAFAAMAENNSCEGVVRCVFDCPQPVRVSNAETAVHLYRIAQEAVGNALKHASPSEIRIGLERHGSALVVEVEDDGSGFEETPGNDGIGLRVMQHRAQLIGGDLKIEPAPAGGTRVSCRVESPV